jgi:hypothetical protein
MVERLQNAINKLVDARKIANDLISDLRTFEYNGSALSNDEERLMETLEGYVR